MRLERVRQPGPCRPQARQRPSDLSGSSPKAKPEPSMPWSRCSRRARTALIGMKLVLGAGFAFAQPSATGDPLYLEVFINGQPTGLIANFVQRPEQRLAITVTELTELRIRSDRLPVDRD